MGDRITPAAAIAAAIAVATLALAAVLFIAPGPESTQRLGLFFAVVGTIVTALVTLLRADQAASQTNGKLDARIQAAVHRANNARRIGDPPATDAEIDAGPEVHP